MRQDQSELTDSLVTHTFSHGGLNEILMLAPTEKVRETFVHGLQNELRTSFGAQVIRGNLFGAHSTYVPAPPASHPSTCLTRGVQTCRPPASVCLQAINGTKPAPIRIGERTVGVTYEDAYARYVLLGDLQPDELLFELELDAVRLAF